MCISILYRYISNILVGSQTWTNPKNVLGHSLCWLLRFGVEIKSEGTSQNMFRSWDLNGEVFG